ncbi:MAG: hypothetical protein Q9170_001035 [Blastenia crenularia]
MASSKLDNSKSLSQADGLVVQNAVASDADAIAKLGATTFKTCFAYSMPAEDMETYLDNAYTPTAISKELDSNQDQFFVAKIKSEVVGFIQMKVGTTEPCIPSDWSMCEVHRIYVSPDRVGGGTGQLLMERGLQWARDFFSDQQRIHRGLHGVNAGPKQPCRGVWLGVWEENLKAQRFYKRWGFEQVGAHDFVMGDTRQTDLVLVKTM